MATPSKPILTIEEIFEAWDQYMDSFDLNRQAGALAVFTREHAKSKLAKLGATPMTGSNGYSVKDIIILPMTRKP